MVNCRVIALLQFAHSDAESWQCAKRNAYWKR